MGVIQWLVYHQPVFRAPVTHSTHVTTTPSGASDDYIFRAWLAAVLGVPVAALTIKQIAGDASPRRYFRLTLEHEGPGEDDPTSASDNAPVASLRGIKHRSLIAVTSPSTENNAAFLQVQRLLESAGLTVPAQYASDLERGYFLMEDLGDVLLASQLTPEAVDHYYPSALNELIPIAGIPLASALLPPFDATRIADEISVFPEWFLDAHLGLEVDAVAENLWQNLLTLLTDVFRHQPQCVVHRDFHSRNIMCLPDDRLGLIDFQDAVVGPVTYDPVSLLKDCYIQWPRPDQLRWLEAHRHALLSAGVAVSDERAFIRDFDLVGLQRHLRVLGVFARLCLRDDKPDYLNDLPLVLAYTREALTLYEAEPAIGGFSGWFEEVVMPRVAEQHWYQRSTPLERR